MRETQPVGERLIEPRDFQQQIAGHLIFEKLGLAASKLRFGTAAGGSGFWLEFQHGNLSRGTGVNNAPAF